MDGIDPQNLSSQKDGQTAGDFIEPIVYADFLPGPHRIER